MLVPKSDKGFVVALPGITRKTLAYGEKTLMVEFHLAKGAVLPLHSHPYEQTGYLVSGRMVLTIAGEAKEVTPGDSWCIAENVLHGAEVSENVVAIEVFAPVRPDYLPPPES